jgi:hypothetical protein
LRNKKRSIKRKISPRKNLYSYIQSQTTRKLSKVLLLQVLENFILPAFISFMSLYVFGFPIAASCESLDGDEGTSGSSSSSAHDGSFDLNSTPLSSEESEIESNKTPQDRVASSSAAGLNLNMPAPPLTDAELLAESEANAAQCSRILEEIRQQAKAIAQGAGVSDEYKLSKIDQSVQYLADVDELDEGARIPHLRQFQKDLVSTETWQKIHKECERWGDGGLC